MGGLRKQMPITFATFAIATAAIAGIPPLAGFFSKDEILWFAYASSRGGSPLLWLVASAASLMTAFYMFRLLWLTFFGTSRMDAETEHHVHESPLSMTGVLVILAVLSAAGGFIPLVHYLEPMLPLPAVPEPLHHLERTLVMIAVGVAFIGLLTAWWFFGGDAVRARRMAPALAPVHRVLAGKYFIDELYEAALGRPLQWLSQRVFLQFGDRMLIDGTLHTLAGIARGTAAALGAVQGGSLHRYALFVVLGVVAAIAWSVRHA